MTSQVNIFYKKNMISAIRLSKKMVFITDKGAIDEFPYVDAAFVVATQGRKVKPWKEAKILLTTERYLARMGAYVIESVSKQGDQGCNFIETPKPAEQLNGYLVKMMQQCICPNCGLSAINETDRPPSEEKCPRCEQAQFERKHNIDILENMIRIHALLKWVKKYNENRKPSPDPV